MAMYIPPQRSPWEMMLPQMAQMMFGQMLQNKMWKERFAAQELATGKAQTAQNIQRMTEAGWREPVETGQLPTGGEYAMSRMGVGAMRPPVPKVTPLKGGGRIFSVGTKHQYIAPTKGSDFDKKYALWKTGEITMDQLLGIKPETTAADIKKYNLYMTQETKAGRKPLDFTPWLKSVKKAGATTITNVLTPTVQTQLQKDLIEAETQAQAFSDIEAEFQDEYLTFPGRVRAKAEIWTDKLGVPIDTEWMEKRQAWYQKSKARFLAYRKWVTGVAGGEKEMKEIAKSYPDPDKNSPAQFRANLKSARTTALKLAKRYRMLLEQGLTEKEAKTRLKAGKGIPLSQIQVTEEKWIVGKTYTNVKGQQAIYLGEGRWQLVK